MSENAITRRSFLAGAAGVTSLGLCAGFKSFDAWGQELSDSGKGDTDRSAHCLCNACSSKCGFTAYVTGDSLNAFIADTNHPSAKGKLCARGYGYAQMVYSEDRLTDPLKKNEAGEFEAISWDQAYSEIGEKVKEILADAGPQSLALVHDPRPSGSFYSNRFIKSLGSPNIYTHATACNLSKASGFAQVIGVGDFTSDIENSAMTMFIGRSYCDSIRPSQVAALQKAHEAGAYIVMVDPRYNASCLFADEWLPINPGTDLALILAMSHVLIYEGLYDKKYIEEHTIGFEEWAQAIRDHTPRWASEITGISEQTITRLARRFAEAAPAASLEASWRAAFGCAYQNSGETARALCSFNTLLGCWNEKGGALFLPKVSPGELDEKEFPSVPKPEGTLLGSEQYPLAAKSMGASLYAAEQAKEGNLKGMFFYNSNMVAGYSNPAYLADALSQLDLMVVIDVQMSETAQVADYVLPDTSYLERLEVPEFLAGMTPCVSLRDKVLDVIHPNTKPVDVIFTELAQACDVGQYFDFTVEELADAQLRSVGISLETLRQMGTIHFSDKAFTYGTAPKWSTPTGKIQFSSEAVAKAGLSPVPVWVEPLTMPADQQLRLIGGKQPIHSHTQTANTEALMQITKDYHLTDVWLSSDYASHHGISHGDTVEVSNEKHTGTSRVNVTQRLNPTALFMPSHYGCSSPDLRTAYQVGLRQMDFVPFHLEPGYGSSMTQETLVTVKKVGA